MRETKEEGRERETKASRDLVTAKKWGDEGQRKKDDALPEAGWDSSTNEMPRRLYRTRVAFPNRRVKRRGRVMRILRALQRRRGRCDTACFWLFSLRARLLLASGGCVRTKARNTASRPARGLRSD